MILSKPHKFAFIHIPKCAGTTVRNLLQFFDSTEGHFTSRVDTHPVLGQLDYVHIPLFALRDYFPEEFEMVRDYWSFTVTRDPFARFASSVSQHLKMYTDRPIHMCAEKEVRKAIDECIGYLSNQPRENHRLPPEYIHFQRQVDYVQLDGVAIIDALYTVADIDILLDDICHHVGIPLRPPVGRDHSAKNQSVVFRGEVLRSIINLARPLTNRVGLILPEKVKKRVRDYVYVPRDTRMNGLFTANCVCDFVEKYYTEDIALYEKAKSGDWRKTP